MYLLQVELLPKLLHFFVVLPIQYGISMISRRSTLTATSNLHQPEVQSVTPFRCTFHCCHLMSSSVSFIFLRAFYRAEFFNFSLPERLNFSLLQFSVPASFRAVTCFSNFTFSHDIFQRFIHWYFLHLHRAGDELPLNNWDLHTDLLSSFSLSWF